LPSIDAHINKQHQFSFLVIDAPETPRQALSRLSFVQGIFRGEQALTIVDADPHFTGPEDLVFGAKYPGKTNELVTQMAINLAVAAAKFSGVERPRLLDPMAGRGTTLLWAHRYGFDAFGVEPQVKDREAFERHVKKQTKLHRLKHRRHAGAIGRTNRQQVGHFVEFEMNDSVMRLVTGDSQELAYLIQKRRFHYIVADLPYGIQHTTPQGTRNPAALLAEVIPGWAQQLAPGGSMVLSFNTYQPKRREIIEIIEASGLHVLDFSARHRMSESIVRDFVVAVAKDTAPNRDS
ncbi:MAG: hypothetical protein AAF449_21630, partial [Myxococcota bacterium]